MRGSGGGGSYHHGRSYSSGHVTDSTRRNEARTPKKNKRDRSADQTVATPRDWRPTTTDTQTGVAHGYRSLASRVTDLDSVCNKVSDINLFQPRVGQAAGRCDVTARNGPMYKCTALACGQRTASLLTNCHAVKHSVDDRLLILQYWQQHRRHKYFYGRPLQRQSQTTTFYACSLFLPHTLDCVRFCFWRC